MLLIENFLNEISRMTWLYSRISKARHSYCKLFVSPVFLIKIMILLQAVSMFAIAGGISFPLGSEISSNLSIFGTIMYVSSITRNHNVCFLV